MVAPGSHMGKDSTCKRCTIGVMEATKTSTSRLNDGQAFALTVAPFAAAVANYCDHVEHNEPADPAWVTVAGEKLAHAAFEYATAARRNLVQLYAARLGSIEARSPLARGTASTEVKPLSQQTHGVNYNSFRAPTTARTTQMSSGCRNSTSCATTRFTSPRSLASSPKLGTKWNSSSAVCPMPSCSRSSSGRWWDRPCRTLRCLAASRARSCVRPQLRRRPDGRRHPGRVLYAR